MVELGDKVKDPISKLEGIVIVRSEYLNGCLRCGVQIIQKKIITDRKDITEPYWFDINQLEILKKAAFVSNGEQLVPKNDKKKHTGGPRSDPSFINPK